MLALVAVRRHVELVGRSTGEKLAVTCTGGFVGPISMLDNANVYSIFGK